MAKIIVFNNDTLKSKRHTDIEDRMETFSMTEDKGIIGGMCNG